MSACNKGTYLGSTNTRNTYTSVTCIRGALIKAAYT